MLAKLLFIFIIQSVYAVEDNCLNSKASIHINSEVLQPILRQAIKINNWAVTSEEVRNSHCRDNMPTLDQIKNLNEEFYQSERQSLSVDGLNLENEPVKLIAAFSDLITNNEEDVTDVSGLVPPDCKKVNCALNSIFGEELGQKLLYLKQFGFNGSELAHDNSSRLRINEVDPLIRSVRAFPSGLLPITKDQQLTKFKRGYTLKAHSDTVVAFAQIAFYDTWSSGRYSPEIMETTSFHEIAHYLSSELDIDDSEEWMSFSDWVDHGDYEFTSGKSDVFCSHYGETNPSEDFAESLVAYRYNPSLLQTVSLEKYNFIKENIFAGVEFTSDEVCENKRIFSSISDSALNTIISQHMASGEASDNMLNSLIASCDKETYQLIMNSAGSQDIFDNCLRVNARKVNVSDEMIQSIIDEMNPTPISSEFTENLLRRTIQNIATERPLDESVVPQVRYHLKKQVTDSIYTNYRNPGLLSSLINFSDNMESCQHTWDDSSYIHFDIISDFDDKNYNLEALNNKEQLQEFAQEICTETGRRGGRMTKSDIRERLNHISP